MLTLSHWTLDCRLTADRVGRNLSPPHVESVTLHCPHSGFTDRPTRHEIMKDPCYRGTVGRHNHVSQHLTVVVVAWSRLDSSAAHWRLTRQQVVVQYLPQWPDISITLVTVT